MFVVVVAGGTGGHFYPGLAVARECQKQGDRVHFIIRKNDYVIPLLEREHIPYTMISSAGLVRRWSIKNILMPFKLALGFVSSFFFLLKNRPDCLLVMGGYLSMPPALAAKILCIPIVLHEQNVIPGLANRLLSRIARRIALSFAASESRFHGEKRVTGNPVRDELKKIIDPVSARRHFKLVDDKLTVLVFGGSLGAHRLNELFLQALSELGPMATQWQFLHFTGDADAAWARECYRKLNLTYHVDAYCHDMPHAYAAADFVVSRSGASTISELVATRKPALLIPYPLATEHHQTANANILRDFGVAQVCEQADLKTGVLAKIVADLLDSKRYVQLASNYAKVDLNPFAAAGRIREMMSSLN